MVYLSTFDIINGNQKNLKKDVLIIQDKSIYCIINDFDKKEYKLPIYGHLCFEILCNQPVFFGGPFCAHHTCEFYQVCSKQTSLTYQGQKLLFNGVFACRDFKKDELIVPYFHLCLFVPKSKCQEIIPDPYSIRIGNKDHSALQYRCAGSLANTILGKPKHNALDKKIAKSVSRACNAYFLISEVDANIIAKEDIKIGDEIFVDYGTGRTEFLDNLIYKSIGFQQEIEKTNSITNNFRF